MDIGFVWDEAKYEKVVSEHNVKFYEVVAAFDDPAGFETPSQDRHEDRWIWLGRTPWDRLLVVVYTEQDSPLLRIITAYDAEGRLVNEYYRRRGF